MAEDQLITVGLRMSKRMHKALKSKAFHEDTHMYEIVDEALRAFGINPDEAGDGKDEKNSRSE